MLSVLNLEARSRNVAVAGPPRPSAQLRYRIAWELFSGESLVAGPLPTQRQSSVAPKENSRIGLVAEKAGPTSGTLHVDISSAAPGLPKAGLPKASQEVITLSSSLPSGPAEGNASVIVVDDSSPARPTLPPQSQPPKRKRAQEDGKKLTKKIKVIVSSDEGE